MSAQTITGDQWETAKPAVVSTGVFAGTCPHCSGNGIQTIHGGTCPRIKAIEYHPDGTTKRIEFHELKP